MSKAPPTLTFRPFLTTDAPRVSEIICRCLREVNSKDYPPDQISRMLLEFTPESILHRFRNSPPVVGELEGSGVVCTARLVENHIRSFFVDPSFHGHGLGAQLLGYLEGELRKQGATEGFVGSSVTARKFYEKYGWVFIEEAVHEVGGRQFHLAKKL